MKNSGQMQNLGGGGGKHGVGLQMVNSLPWVFGFWFTEYQIITLHSKPFFFKVFILKKKPKVVSRYNDFPFENGCEK